MSQFDLRFDLSGTLRKDWPRWMVSLPSELQRSQSELAGWSHAHTLFKYMKKFVKVFVHIQDERVESGMRCHVWSDLHLLVQVCDRRVMFSVSIQIKVSGASVTICQKIRFAAEDLSAICHHVNCGGWDGWIQITPAVVPVDLSCFHLSPQKDMWS